ncbi:hypothetical protein OPQ81_008424 [Rhizoctonia solani]|nr:hypothetical protein OPQ81_008424 [Rhizoctonia solani]
MAHRNIEVVRGDNSGNDNNLNANPPDPDQNSNILASTSLKTPQDRGNVLRNMGYLCGIRVNNNDGPQSLTRQVAKHVGAEPPFVREIRDFLTETITTTTERETNYIHCGWSIDAASTTSPWISSRIAANNQSNPKGTWLTRRTLVQRLCVRVSLEDLAPTPGFEAEIEAALKKTTTFQQFEAVYRVFHDWGDVVPLEFEMGISWVITDHETNMSKLPSMTTWTDAHYLTTVRTARTTRQEGMGTFYWDNDIWPNRIINPLDWRQTRIRTVVATTKLLPVELQGQLLQLYARRLSYVPATIVGHGDSYGSWRVQDDTSRASRNVSSITIDASNTISSIEFIYLDKASLGKNEGSEKDNSENGFVLMDGEYITEMTIWRDEWVRGLQFVTSFGRCSPNFGVGVGIPIVTRCIGGILAGIVGLIQTGHNNRFHEIQGIWRRDILDKAPKEEDVFSEYFGSKDRGRAFNDRVVVQSSSMAISKIEIWCDSLIYGLQLTYIDTAGQGANRIKTERHGGLGGIKKEFIIEPGEIIIEISGRHTSQRITQLSFVTDKGRASELFGEENANGASDPFSVASPRDKDGNHMRLQYVCGKSDTVLIGIMFVWTLM